MRYLLSSLFNDFYLSFENKFRGSFETIKNRLKVYLKILEVFDKKDCNVVDLGAGRGEWLDLLGENGYNCIGVDINTAMVDLCKEKGLDVRLGSALGYLSDLPEFSVQVITGFHIVEHLNFDDLVVLFKEAYRVLKDDGVIIFETPNPENIQVGSNTFYLDPTHMRPIPPLLLDFIAEFSGFNFHNILRLNPCPELSLAFMGKLSVQEKDFFDKMYRSQDYSIVACKVSNVESCLCRELAVTLTSFNSLSSADVNVLSEAVNKMNKELSFKDTELSNLEKQVVELKVRCESLRNECDKSDLRYQELLSSTQSVFDNNIELEIECKRLLSLNYDLNLRYNQIKSGFSFRITFPLRLLRVGGIFLLKRIVFLFKIKKK